MNSNAFTAADMTTAAANGHRDGYQAGYADAVKAVEVGKPAAAPVVRRAIADEAPFGLSTAEKIAWARGVNDCLAEYRDAAIPEIDSGLYSWLQERGICPDSHEGMIEMGEVVEALNEHERQLLESTPAAPVVDVATLRALADRWATDRSYTGSPVDDIRALIEKPTMSTPAAPGIDHLRSVINALSRNISDAYETACQNGDERMQTVQNARQSLLNTIREALPQSDASPKGGSTDPRKLPCLSFAVFDEFGVGADDRVADYGRACATAAMQPTSAEVKP